MEQFGLIVLASLFVLAGINHIRTHAAMVGYTASVLGDIPAKNQLAFLGGWPTGVFLIVAGVGTAFNHNSIFAYGLVGFLVLATALFHRNFVKDPGGFKGVALAGALLAIVSNVH
jgi:hypothetical protein